LVAVEPGPVFATVLGSLVSDEKLIGALLPTVLLALKPFRFVRSGFAGVFEDVGNR
jgi:hypothetical protein